MVTVEEALNLIDEHTLENSTIKLKTVDSLGYVLANEVLSEINMPPFAQSAMDGYAVHYDQNITSYRLTGEIQAGGKYTHFNLQKGEAVRIYTGAAVPMGANCVVKQEIAIRNKHNVSFTEPIQFGENIRPVGEQIKKGNLALAKGIKITPGGIGFLTGLGITEIEVYKKPHITIIVTGNELTKPGLELEEGKIYESNSYMLSSALTSIGIANHEILSVKDTFEDTKSIIRSSLDKSDVILLSGGISVGDYDFVGKALNDLGVREIFYKVKQKPGKPLFFGKIENKYIFALPGNPAASLTSFYIYGLRALNKITGMKEKGLLKITGTLSKNYLKKGERAQFLKAYISENNEATILDSQSSAMLSSFASANAIVYIPLELDEIKKGDFVQVYLLP